jgi:hypothetical protein
MAANIRGAMAIVIQPMDDRWARLTVRDYLCSICWSHLILFPVTGSRLLLVKCSNCLDETRGFVTKYYAESRRLEDAADYLEVREMLRGMGIITSEHSGKSAEQLIRELGF